MQQQAVQAVQEPTAVTGSRRRGFGAMTPERRREVSRMGGRAAQEKGTAHQFTKEEVSAGGKKGWGAAARRRRAARQSDGEVVGDVG